MKPITFTCRDTLPLTPHEIVQQILDVAKWPDFQGYGPIPGIESAEIETQTPHLVGTRIRVTNRDGSTHVEEIVEWQADRRLRLKMGEFSPPLSRLASSFVETWEFQREADRTGITRSFAIHARSFATWPVLWMISFFIQPAIARHLREMRLVAMTQGTAGIAAVSRNYGT